MSLKNPFEGKVYDLYTELIYATISELEFDELAKEGEEELKEIRRKKK